MLKVDKNIAVERRLHTNSFSVEARLAAEEMVDGDSVRVSTLSERNTMKIALQRLHGPKSVITRKEYTGGYRVWLIKPCLI